MKRSLPIFLLSLFTSLGSGQVLLDVDFTSGAAAADKLVVEGLKLTSGGLDASGQWLNVEKWAVLRDSDSALRDATVTARFVPNEVGNANAYAELRVRATDRKTGAGVRLGGGRDRATVEIVENGTVIKTKLIDGLSPAEAEVTVTLTAKGQDLTVKIVQSPVKNRKGIQETISARIAGTPETGYFIYEARSANEGPILKSLSIARDGPVRGFAIDNWPPVPTQTTIPAPASTATAAVSAPGPLQPVDVPVSNLLLQDTRVLSPEWICLVLDSTAASHALLKNDEIAQRELTLARQQKGGSRDWYLEVAQKYLFLAATTRVRMSLIPKYETTSLWTVGSVPPSEATFFPASVDAFPAEGPDFSPEPGASLPRVADYVYLKLAKPLSEGATLPIRHADGLETALTFKSLETVSWGLKVNQVGYLPAARKFAYLGMWAGFAGAVDYASFAGQPFEVRPFEPGASWREGNAVGSPAFTGTIQLRARSGDQPIAGQKSTITGEDVYELDFSGLNAPGLYCVHVPGLGRSWPFHLGADVFGEAFYHSARALYHQRGSIELKAPYTAWERGPTKQPILRGGFVPETDRWYDPRCIYAKEHSEDPKAGFRDEAGNPVGLSAFTMIHSTATKDPFPGMETGGGWHDAADYDRRIHHYNCVWDLCGAYEMFPQKFSDGQLTIPESGNGIPDILDEAAVQVDFFLKTQQPNGGVSSWVEQTSHPDGGRPEDDARPFYVSLPDRTGSLQFAACAAYLGRMMEPFDAVRSKRYLGAAVKAFQFGSNPENRIRDLKFTVAEGSVYDRGLIGKTLVFNEAAELKTRGSGRHNIHHLNALIQLASAGSEDHRELLNGIDILRSQREWMPETCPVFSLVTPFLQSGKLGISPETRTAEIAELIKISERWNHGGQDQLAYRQLWRKPEDGTFLAMAWGTVHGPVSARLPLLLFRATGDEAWRQRVLFGLDWEYGCNSTGRTFTTGIGTVFPVVFQHLHSMTDRHLEPVPGFTPYAPTGGLGFEVFTNQFALLTTPHASVKHFFPPTARVLLPQAAGQAEIQLRIDQLRDPFKDDQAYQLVRDAVGPKIPVMRRFFVHPTLSPGQNEFTVGESLSPQAAILGSLLPDGWKPDQGLLKQIPREKAGDLPFYAQP